MQILLLHYSKIKMKNIKLLILFLLYGSSLCSFATLNPDEYRLLVFNRVNQVNNTNHVDIVLSDNGQDEHSYTINKGDSLNWVYLDRLYTTSLYSGATYHFARISPNSSPRTGEKWEGTLKLEYVNYCDDQGHNHPNQTVNCNVLCLYDETGDTEDDKNDNSRFISIFPQSYWNGWNDNDYTYYSSGILWNTNFHDLAYTDTDVWNLRGLEIDKTYCLEVKTVEKDRPTLKLEVSQGPGENDKRSINKQNVFDSDGVKDGKTYRLYFTAKSTEAFANIAFNNASHRSNIKYKIALMKCKPVVLVHGLRGKPRTNGGSGTDFGDLKDFIGYINKVRPCVCLQFPWNSGIGSYKDYVGDKNKEKTLFHYLYESNKYFHAKATIMTYSTGGTILYDQMFNNEFDEVVQNAVIVASPFWGVHIANSFSFGPNISSDILKDLSRGSKVNWERYQKSSKWGKFRDITIVVGDGSRTSLRYAVFYANHYGKEINELKDRHRGDGLVAYHSANLKNKHKEVGFFEINLGHNILVEFELSDLGKRKPFFEDFIQKINNWENYGH